MKKLLYSLAIIGTFFIGFYSATVAIDSIKIEKELIETKTFVGEESIVPAVNEVFDAVFLIESFRSQNLSGSGTGFVYKTDDENGYIITNYHVVANNETFLAVCSNGLEHEAELVGYDLFTDLAVLKIDVDSVKQVAKIGNSQDMELGERVFTVGSPLGRQYIGTVTGGFLSARERLVETTLSGQKILFELLQTDAAINPGNSGGPLVNSSGEVIGVNSMKIVQDTIEGLGFAIPMENAMKIVEVIETGETVERPFLGVSLIDASDRQALFLNRINLEKQYDNGVLVTLVQEDSDAEAAELEVMDVILKMNDEVIKGSAHFRFLLYKNSIGDEITLEVERDNKIIEIKVELTADLPE